MASGLSPTDRVMLADAMKATARAEIMAAAKSIDGQVRKVVQATLEPFGQRFADLYQKCNELDIHVHALVEVLVAKGVIEKKDVREAAERVVGALVAKHEAMKAAKAAAEKAGIAPAPAPAAPAAAPAAVAEALPAA